MSDLRDLLERAVPRESAPAVYASEIRALGQRRRRRGQAVGAVISAVAISASAALGAQVLRGTTTPAPARPATGATSPTPSPSLTGPQFAGLVGTRWIPDLVAAGISTAQSYPGDPGAGPQAMLTFGADHRLILFFATGGRRTTVPGTWTATSTTRLPNRDSRGGIRIALDAPPGVSGDLEFLISHLELATDYAMSRPSDPRPYLEPLTMEAYRDNGVSLVLDEVRPSAHLPAPYPSGS